MKQYHFLATIVGNCHVITQADTLEEAKEKLVSGDFSVDDDSIDLKVDSISGEPENL